MDWRAAAKKFQEAVKREKDASIPTALKEIEDPTVRALYELNFNKAVADLEAFVKGSEGMAAMELLGASKRWVRFAEDGPDGGHTLVYLLDEKGLQKVCEAGGMWTAYAKELPKPIVETITARQMVLAAVDRRIGGKKPEEIMSWLCAQLDEIAASAPK